jgi:signal transduction histidine kinase
MTKRLGPKHEMGGDARIQPRSDERRHEARLTGGIGDYAIHCEIAGGCIWASANSGRGATFSFTLPSRVEVAA